MAFWTTQELLSNELSLIGWDLCDLYYKLQDERITGEILARYDLPESEKQEILERVKQETAKSLGVCVFEAVASDIRNHMH